MNASNSPPAAFTPPLQRSPLRDAIGALTRRPEPELLPGLLQAAQLDTEQAEAAQALALRLAQGLRERRTGLGRAGLVQALLQEFALSSQEGVALMCLAEALLRIPDAATRDALIRDKIARGDWRAHLGASPSLFVNAAAWGLLLTGKLVATHSAEGLGAALKRVVGRGGEPLIRRGVDLTMRLMGEQFVIGETIAAALATARQREAQGFRHSYDMLGEAALTDADARRYLAAYEQAIDAIGAASGGRGVHGGPGISIKLSALHPRYARTQVQRVHAELYPRLLGLALRARAHDIGLNIDAEEADRLELSLDLLERLCHEPALAGWHGIGFVIQAYGKRCPAVVDWLIDLGRRSGHRLMVRLVKGAYWDSEIKRAQADGLAGYPVYTRKAYTDVAYLACARRLLAAADAVYPQFATHNAHTLAAVHALAGSDAGPERYEFQCLHGMGEALYEQVVAPVAQGGLGRACRIYAPVGTHETLLAYLVRRLLENGANTSFVHRIADTTLPLSQLVEDPVRTVHGFAEREGALGLPHPAIALPVALYGGTRANSRGLDLADEATLRAVGAALQSSQREAFQAEPLLAVPAQPDAPRPVCNPAERADVIGTVREASAADVQGALAAADAAAASWAAVPAAERAALLERAADGLDADGLTLIALLVREAGKTVANALAEVREAIDFLRYDAQQLRRQAADEALPQEPAAGLDRPLGPVVCISPWNFPLAIFTGQVAAALAAGNPVLAKPAEQTPLVAAAAVRVLHAAGVPRAALQLLPGRGETVGAALVADARVQGVVFTGSTEVARLLQRTLAQRLGSDGRPVPLIAETGGQNAMVVDSSALAEQVVADALASAFDSAGQRCSALRVLCVQHDVADRVFAMLEGAAAELRVGDPRALATDVGPVIDEDARAGIERHLQQMAARGHRILRPALPDAALTGCFVAPAIVEIAAVGELQREVFGPVLHVLRYRRERLDELLAQINATGYALTLGVHTRIDETVARVVGRARAGNVYVNRNIVGAVVGVQPFGGEGLSGTGPKAGGPLYLPRLRRQVPPGAARAAVAASGSEAAALPGLQGVHGGSAVDGALQTLGAWAQAQGRGELARTCAQHARQSPCIGPRLLPGPTGESNFYALQPRAAVLGLADDEGDRLLQLAAVLAVGGCLCLPAGDAMALRAALPAALHRRVIDVGDWTLPEAAIDTVLLHGDGPRRREVAAQLARRPGPIVPLHAFDPGEPGIPLERLVVERSLSVNTAAAGGNASLMAIG